MTADPNAAGAIVRRRSFASRLLRRAGPTGMIATGCLLIGLTLGVAATAMVPSARVVPTPVQVTVLPNADGDESKVVMPDVRGLSERDARQTLADHGIPASKVEIAKMPHLTPDGFVAAQDPINGTVNPTRVTLSLPTAATVPDLLGQPEDRARASLLAMGAQVQISRRYDPDTEPGQILKSNPGRGRPLTATVRLVVAAAAQARPLAAVASTGSCDQTDTASVGGSEVAASVVCSSDRSDQETYWLVRRRVAAMSALVGLDDHDDPQAKVRLTVTGDNKTLYTKTLTYGRPDRLNLDLSGVLRLGVRTERLDEGDGDAVVVLGDAALTGSAEDLATLEDR